MHKQMGWPPAASISLVSPELTTHIPRARIISQLTCTSDNQILVNWCLLQHAECSLRRASFEDRILPLVRMSASALHTRHSLPRNAHVPFVSQRMRVQRPSALRVRCANGDKLTVAITGMRCCCTARCVS
jgi:hypothetical protein